MYPPTATTSNSRGTSLVTITLLLINAILLLSTFANALNGSMKVDQMFRQFGIVPAAPTPWSFVTYMFLHDGLGHLLTNAVYLLVFGWTLEQAIGRGRFLIWYLIGGIAGGALQFIVTLQFALNGANRPIVGASAACAGLIGLYTWRFYRAKVEIVGLSSLIRWFRKRNLLLNFPTHIPVLILVTAFLFWEMFQCVRNLFYVSTAQGVANWAHVGGFVVGLTAAWALRFDQEAAKEYAQADQLQQTDLRSNLAKAETLWEQEIRRDRFNPKPYSELGQSWLRQGSTEDAANYYVRGISALMDGGKIEEAIALYQEMRENGLRMDRLLPSQLFTLGENLRKKDKHALTAETLLAASSRAPEAPEAQRAMLDVATLYFKQLNRKTDAAMLVHHFLERYPQSTLRLEAENLLEMLS